VVNWQSSSRRALTIWTAWSISRRYRGRHSGGHEEAGGNHQNFGEIQTAHRKQTQLQKSWKILGNKRARKKL